MARIGYARVSTIDQHPESRQPRSSQAGCERTFTDHGVSGTKAGRPQLNACLAYLFASWLDSMVPAVFDTDAALARAVGVHRSYIARWRRGVTPEVPSLLKLAKVTGMSAETLLQIAGYRPSDAGDGESR